jgi:hypothetical protein
MAWPAASGFATRVAIKARFQASPSVINHHLTTKELRMRNFTLAIIVCVACVMLVGCSTSATVHAPYAQVVRTINV